MGKVKLRAQKTINITIAPLKEDRNLRKKHIRMDEDGDDACRCASVRGERDT